MLRRTFLASPAFSAPAFAVQARGLPGRLKISSVEILRVEGRRPAVSGVNAQYQANPIHIYDEHRPKPYQEGQPVERTVTASALYLTLKTDAGVEGLYGPVDREAAIVVDQQLRGFIAGKDALAVEALWDKMYRSNRHSRRGHYMMAISAVDNALWDLRGRYYNAPVYRLLGGPTRERVEAYGSCLGFSIEPQKMEAKVRELKQSGFRHQKWFLAYGPGSGAEGLRKNVEMVEVLRKAGGEDLELMFDAFMGWDLNYALAWAKRVERFRPRWIEEAFAPDKISSFVELRRATSIPVASGEHIYNRWESHEYLKAGALHVLQTDPEWCGGVSELVKICVLASACDVQVVPHGHALHAALHAIASQSPMTCPLLEYLINKMAYFNYFEKHQLVPQDGFIRLPERPGFGIELDEARVEKRSAVRWSQSE
jgi:L-alanine-DL-glutamate epimerase-like enolase superfamily enzyme